MNINMPYNWDFPNHYKGDGRKPLDMEFIYPETGAPVDIASARMQLRTPAGFLACEFSSEAEDEGYRFVIDGNKIEFPILDSWDIKPGRYSYDLEVTDSSGFVSTYLRGHWEIVNDITK